MAYLRRERSASPSKSQSPPRGRRSRSASPSKSQSPPRGRRSRSRSLSKSRRSRSRSKEAEVAANRPNPANPGNNLYVTGLSMRVNNTDLEKCFSKEGKVVDCHLVTDPHTKESRGFAFITMDSVEDADRCIKHLHRSVLEGRLITVEKAKRKRGRTPTPGKYQGVVDKRGGGQRRSRSPSPRRWQIRDPNPRERRGRSRSPYAKRREDEYSSSYRRHRDDSYSARGGRDDPYASRGGGGYR